MILWAELPRRPSVSVVRVLFPMSTRERRIWSRRRGDPLLKCRSLCSNQVLSRTWSSSPFLGTRQQLRNTHRSIQWKSQNLCPSESAKVKIARMASGMLATQTPSRQPLHQEAMGAATLGSFRVNLPLEVWTIPLGIARKDRGQFHQIASMIHTGWLMLPSPLSDKCMGTRIQLRVPHSEPNKSRKETSRLVKSTMPYTTIWWGKPSRSLICKFMSTKRIHGIKDSQLIKRNINIRST